MRERLIVLACIAATCCGGKGGREPTGIASQKNESDETIPLNSESVETGVFANESQFPPGSSEGTIEEKNRKYGSESTAELELFNDVNEERKRVGLGELRWAKDLASVAKKYSLEIATTGNLSHDSPISGGMKDRVKAGGIHQIRLSENLAMASSISEAHKGLMNSTHHRANILDPHVLEMGIGVTSVTESGARIIYVTQLFMIRARKIDIDKAKAAVLKVVNDTRASLGVKPLNKMKCLSQAAVKLSGSCFENTVSDTGTIEKACKKPGGVFRVVMFMTKVESLEGLMSGVKAFDRIALPDYTHIGVSVVQDKNLDNGICAVLLLGK